MFDHQFKSTFKQWNFSKMFGLMLTVTKNSIKTFFCCEKIEQYHRKHKEICC